MNTKIKILHLEDFPEDAELVEYELHKNNINTDIRVVDNEKDYEKMLNEFNPDIVLSDHTLLSFDSFQALAILKEKKLDIPFILVTATMSEEFAVDIMKQGAADYILKDRLQRLPSAVMNSIEKHGLEVESRAANERLLFHLENTPLGFIEWDNHGFAKSWSKRAEEIFGWNGKEFLEGWESRLSQVYEEDLLWVSKIFEQLISGEVERNQVQHKNTTKDGRVIWSEWFNSVMKDKDGKVKSIMSLVEDITEKKSLEKQKDDFLSIASHELRTPLTTIKACGQIAESLLEKNGDVEMLDIIKRSNSQVNNLTTLVENLLDFTEIQKGKLIRHEAFFDFPELVKDVIDDMQKTSYMHEIKNNSCGTANTFGDKDKLSQVIINLISNAIKYSPKANRIVINTELQKDGIKLSIQDFGIGMSLQDQENVFEQFYSIKRDCQSSFPGMGIGLYICSEIITGQGGKIWVESIIDEGSVFCIWMPFDHRKKKPAKVPMPLISPTLK